MKGIDLHMDRCAQRSALLFKRLAHGIIFLLCGFKHRVLIFTDERIVDTTFELLDRYNNVTPIFWRYQVHDEAGFSPNDLSYAPEGNADYFRRHDWLFHITEVPAKETI
jgi:hypothetical protein